MLDLHALCPGVHVKVVVRKDEIFILIQNLHTLRISRCRHLNLVTDDAAGQLRIFIAEIFRIREVDTSCRNDLAILFQLIADIL